ncbi:MAG: GGDEF domain-containing protein [Butyrivibrio sp.]|nr:GGDEF domain-containing protein [Butyrivibrio sp.]
MNKIKKHGFLLLNTFFVIILFMGILLKDDFNFVALSFGSREITELVVVSEDGSESQVTTPYNIGKEGNTTLNITLPDVSGSEVLRVECKYQNIEAYVDGEHIFHSGVAVFGNIETTLGNYNALIPLKKSYSGKTMTIVVAPRNYSYSIYVQSVEVTTMHEYALRQIFASMPYYFFGVLVLGTSLVSMFGLICIHFYPGETDVSYLKKSLWCIIVFGFVLSSWMISDFHVMGILTGKMAFSGYLNYITFMVIPILFLYLISCFIHRKNYLLRVMIGIASLNFFVRIILFWWGIWDMPKFLIVSQIIYVLSIVAVMITSAMNLRNIDRKALKKIILPSALFVFCAFYSGYQYITNKEWMLTAGFASLFYIISVLILMINMVLNMFKTGIEVEIYKKRAYIDEMTGIPNRRAYEEKLDLIRNEGVSVDQFFITLDINGLKNANDLKGHQAGDELIKGAAQCIKEVFTPEGTVYRTGGDEFFVSIQCSKDELLNKIMRFNEICNNFAGSFINSISVSIGYVCAGDYNGKTLDELIHISDEAMYEAKNKYYEKEGIKRRT